MAGFKTILVTTDFSPASRPAIDVAADLARRYDGELVLFHAYQLPMLGPYAPVQLPVDEIEQAATEALGKLAAEVAASGVRVRTMLALGDPGVEVVAAAGREHADLVVLGTHGRSGLKRLLLGSVAEHVVRHAECPVMTVRAREPAS